jgi:hypothetical protein
MLAVSIVEHDFYFIFLQMPRTDLAQTEAGLKKQFEELKKEEAAIIAEQKDIFRRNNGFKKYSKSFNLNGRNPLKM